MSQVLIFGIKTLLPMSLCKLVTSCCNAHIIDCDLFVSIVIRHAKDVRQLWTVLGEDTYQSLVPSLCYNNTPGAIIYDNSQPMMLGDADDSKTLAF